MTSRIASLLRRAFPKSTQIGPIARTTLQLWPFFVSYEIWEQTKLQRELEDARQKIKSLENSKVAQPAAEMSVCEATEKVLEELRGESGNVVQRRWSDILGAEEVLRAWRREAGEGKAERNEDA
jgi:hypothetical protein